MKNKYFAILTILISFSIISCKENIVDRVEEKDVFRFSSGILYYKDLPFSGITIEKYENEKLKYSIPYKNGFKEGELKYFFEDGELHSIQEFNDGFNDGESFYYFPNGNIESKKNYKMGKRDGLWEFFNDNGEVIKSMNWKEGSEIKN
jgi:antitoxin component YwqK of YwqJK toxin-antitoxin module